MPFFTYGSAETDYLTKKDKKMGALIERVGPIERVVTPDPFAAIIGSIISQQISGKAADTVERRLRERVGELTPEVILPLTPDDLRLCGMSYRKAGYIRTAAEAAASGAIDFSKLHTLSDDEVIATLTALPGIGVWTCEMLLIFCFERPNVLSFGDLAIRKGIMRLYGYKTLDRAKFERLRKRYTPCASVASLYLWHHSAE
ncbi:DNA-3-methyladenine glycosylase 2 family protein [Oscillospiraceae bacterium OttesenSCG-928-G22]|nr:DNA-3-methyladenine glycosylase 2 family protein [Oscillospiraceae bacterium OttesenSCG-928-G22]